MREALDIVTAGDTVIRHAGYLCIVCILLFLVIICAVIGPSKSIRE